MKLIITIAICVLRLYVNCQIQFGQNQHYTDLYHPQYNQQYNQYNDQYNQQFQLRNQQNSQQYNQQYSQKNTESSRAIYHTTQTQNIAPYSDYSKAVNNINPAADIQFRSNVYENNRQVTDRNSYLQAISRNDLPVQYSTEQTAPFGEKSSPIYSTQQNNAAFPSLTTQPGSFESLQQADPAIMQNFMNSISNFGFNLIKVASQLKPGNVIMSPTSIATAIALLQQGATGEAQRQISSALNMPPDISSSVFGNIAAHMTKRRSRNILTTANNIFVSNTFNLSHDFKSLAIRNFGSSVTPSNFANPLRAVQEINRWVAENTNHKINNLLAPGSLSPATQLVLLNAVYFKGVWETKFKPEKTRNDKFYLYNGQEKMVPFMNIRNSYQVGYDTNTQALVTILPFEGRQYSLILILPKKKDNVDNVMSVLSADALQYYQTFRENEITVQIPKFVLKTDTDLSPVLRNMGITNIFGSKSELTGIGLYSNNPPQISKAVHAGYLSIDEEGVTAAAATGVVAIALSYDDSSVSFTADRPFIAVLWDNQLSIPVFISKIEDPS